MPHLRKEMLTYLLAELRRSVSAEDNPDESPTRAQALARRVVSKALEGDARMLTQLFDMLDDIAGADPDPDAHRQKG